MRGSGTTFHVRLDEPRPTSCRHFENGRPNQPRRKPCHLPSRSPGREFQASTHPLAFHVEDVAAARAELESKGVEFLAETMDSGVCHMAPFADPDGNVLMLHHRYAPRA